MGTRSKLTLRENADVVPFLHLEIVLYFCIDKVPITVDPRLQLYVIYTTCTMSDAIIYFFL